MWQIPDMSVTSNLILWRDVTLFIFSSIYLYFHHFQVFQVVSLYRPREDLSFLLQKTLYSIILFSCFFYTSLCFLPLTAPFLLVDHVKNTPPPLPTTTLCVWFGTPKPPEWAARASRWSPTPTETRMITRTYITRITHALCHAWHKRIMRMRRWAVLVFKYLLWDWGISITGT